jgi:hypothetical protein
MRAPGGASGAGTAYAKRVQLTGTRMAQYHNGMVVEAKVRGRESCLVEAWSVFEAGEAT